MKTFSFLAASLVVNAAQGAASIEYSFIDNGANWGSLEADGNVCGTGMEQSPIDLYRTAEGSDMAEVFLTGYEDYSDDRRIVELPNTL